VYQTALPVWDSANQTKTKSKHPHPPQEMPEQPQVERGWGTGGLPRRAIYVTRSHFCGENRPFLRVQEGSDGHVSEIIPV